MATQYDIKPGIFETVAGDPLGTFVLDQWKHFELDGEFKFLVANPVIKQLAVVVPPSAYELKIDTAASAQETTASGASRTLYGQIRITNVTYVGVELNFSGDNYGTYVSNESVRGFLASGIATKTAPGVDLFIENREPVEFSGDSGLSIVSANSGEIALWDSGPVYSVAGTLARLEGITASATGEPLNQNKTPLLPINSQFWYLPKDEKELIRIANQGLVVGGEMSVIHDRADAQYQQNLLIGKRAIGGTIYNLSLIHLDGTVVTGNTTLENLFGIGGDVNPYIDIFAPDVVGTRALIDMGGHVIESMTSGGVVDTMGAIHDDYMQRITGSILSVEANGRGTLSGASGAFTPTNLLTGISANASGSMYGQVNYNNASSIFPNPAKTNDDRTAHAAIVAGISYIVVMTAA